MPAFATELGADESDAIRAYVVEQALRGQRVAARRASR